MDGLGEALKNQAELGPYLEKNAARVLSDWTYAAGTSNLSTLGSHTHTLVRALEACSQQSTLNSVALSLAQEIIKDHLKIIYRSLFLTRPRQTVPAIELLQRLARIAADALYNSFDLSLKVIPKLLVSKDFRLPFIRFYITWIESVGAVPRKDLISQKKIIKGWIGKLSEDNDLEITQASYKCFEKSVVHNNFLTKQQKLAFFNDSTLQSLVKLLSLDQAIAQLTSEFLILLFTDDQGVSFPDAGWYSQVPNNRLILSFLQILRPWETLSQMKLVETILAAYPELMYPYFDHMAKVYPFIPKASMFWFNYSITILRALQVPIPELDSVRVPDFEVVVANILPQPLTKAHLYAAITYADNGIVAFNAAQIVLQSLRKLEKVLVIYQQNIWDSTALVAAIQERIPAIQVFSTLNKSSLMQATLLSCAAVYYRVFGTASVALLPTSLVNSVLEKRAEGLDRIQAQEILEIQASVLGPTKWYNKAGDEHCFFTRLLQFVLINPELAKSAIQLLNSLVKPLLVMQKDTFASPIDALVFTLEVAAPSDTDQRKKLWRLVDEAISRSARAPYAYIDKFPDVSPFASALAEQFAFVDGIKDQIEHWLASFLRALAVIGEKTQVLADTFKLGTLSLDDYFEFVLSAPAKSILSRDDLLLKIGTPLELMATITRISRSPELAQHLLDNIPPNFVKSLSHESCFRPIFASGDKSIIALLSLLKSQSITSPELEKFIEASDSWYLGTEFVSSEFLETKIRALEHISSAFAELSKRRFSLPFDLVVQHLDQLEYLRNLNWDRESIVKLMKECKSSKSIAALVEASHHFDESIDSSPEVLLAATEFAPHCISPGLRDRCVALASNLLATDQLTAIKLFTTFKDSIPDHRAQLLDVLDSTKKVLTPVYASLNMFVESEKWTKNAVLALTKFFSESQVLDTELNFIEAFIKMLESVKISKMVQPESLNALITSLIKRIELGSSQVLMRLLNGLLVENVKGIKHSRHLQKLLEMEPGFFDHKLLLNLALWRLFNMNSAQNSTKETQLGVLRHYSGLANSADNLLLDILRTVEETVGLSWADDVVFWDLQSKTNLQEYERPALVQVIDRGNKLQVTLCEDLITSSTTNFDPTAKALLPQADQSLSETIERLQEQDIMHPCNGYNDEFLLGCISSCDQLVHEEKLDVKILAEVKLLPFVLCCLCSHNTNVSSTAQMLLEAAASSVTDDKYKESVAVTLVVNKALLFISQNGVVPAHIAIILAQIAAVAVTPSHFLHEKVSDWLLAGPSIQPFDLPMYGSILKSEAPTKPQELQWLVKSLTQTLVDAQVCSLYIKQGVFEWVFAQLSSLSPKHRALKALINKFLTKAKLSGISNGLVRRTGALSYDPDFLLLNTSSGVTEWMGYV